MTGRGLIGLCICSVVGAVLGLLTRDWSFGHALLAFTVAVVVLTLILLPWVLLPRRGDSARQ